MIFKLFNERYFNLNNRFFFTFFDYIKSKDLKFETKLCAKIELHSLCWKYKKKYESLKKYFFAY